LRITAKDAVSRMAEGESAGGLRTRAKRREGRWARARTEDPSTRRNARTRLARRRAAPTAV